MKENIEDSCAKDRRASPHERERETEETKRGPKRETRRAGGVIGISLVM